MLLIILMHPIHPTGLCFVTDESSIPKCCEFYFIPDENLHNKVLKTNKG